MLFAVRTMTIKIILAWMYLLNSFKDYDNEEIIFFDNNHLADM